MSLLPEGGGGEVTLETTSKNSSGKEVSIWSSKFVFSWLTLAGVIHSLFIFSPYFYYWMRNAGVWTPGPALRGVYRSPPLTFLPVKLHSWGPASISERPEEVLGRRTVLPAHHSCRISQDKQWKTGRRSCGKGGGAPALPSPPDVYQPGLVSVRH